MSRSTSHVLLPFSILAGFAWLIEKLLPRRALSWLRLSAGLRAWQERIRQPSLDLPTDGEPDDAKRVGILMWLGFVVGCGTMVSAGLLREFNNVFVDLLKGILIVCGSVLLPFAVLASLTDLSYRLLATRHSLLFNLAWLLIVIIISTIMLATLW